MGKNITQLVSKMLFCDQILQRMSISKNIFNILKSSAYGVGGVAEAMKEHFASRIKACVLNPSSKHRESVCEIAKFYDVHAEEDLTELTDAA
jgi:hypothetical protein